MTEYRGIAFVGAMAAGKTTLADLLIENYGFRKLSMIGAFRDLFGRAYPGIGKGDEMTVERELRCRWIDCPEYTDEFGYDRPPHTHVRKVKVSGRQQMQDFAPATRSVDRMFWTRVAFNDAEAHMQAGIPVVSDDVRYASEAQMARDRGLLVVKIETPREVRLERYKQLYGRRPTAAEEAAPTEQNIDQIEVDRIVDGEEDPMVNVRFLAALVGASKRVRISKEDTTPE